MRIVDMPEFKDKSQVLSFEEDVTLFEAITVMGAKDYGACLVTRKGRLVGIFTERDLLRKVAPALMDLKKTILKDVMSKNVKTAQETDPVEDCLRRMSQGRFRHLPIVDENKAIRGMLSQGDFVAFTMSDIMARIKGNALANMNASRATPLKIMIAVFVYTLGLLFIASAINHWFGM